MRKIATLLVAYMLCISLCLTGIVLNSDSASASASRIGGGTKNPNIDFVLWMLVWVFTASLVISVTFVALKNNKNKISQKK